MARKEMQERAEAKVREQERRAEEQRRAKEAADEEWRRAQHARELQRKAEEEALEREAKVGPDGWLAGWVFRRRQCCPAGLSHVCSCPISPSSREQVQDAERYRREMELLAREQEEEKRRRQEAYARWVRGQGTERLLKPAQLPLTPAALRAHAPPPQGAGAHAEGGGGALGDGAHPA